MDGVKDGFLNGVGRRHVVRDTGSSPELRRIFQRLKIKSKNISSGIAYTYNHQHTSQMPRILTKRLLGKRDASICETMNTFDVNADCSIMGMFEV